MKSRDRYDSLIQYYAEQYAPDWDWLWLKAQVRAESDFNPLARSPVGAKGLAQVMDPTWNEWMKPPSDPFNPEHALMFQARYMEWLYKHLPDYEQATAAYNCGIGRVRRLGASWRDLIPTETTVYLRHIRNYFKEYTGGDGG